MRTDTKPNKQKEWKLFGYFVEKLNINEPRTLKGEKFILIIILTEWTT